MVVQVKSTNEKSADLINREIHDIDDTKTDPKDALFRKLRDDDDPELREIAIVGKKELLKTNFVIDQSDPALLLKDELYKRMSDEPDTFEWVQSALGDGIWYYDMELGAQWYSPDFKKLFGYEDHEVPNVPSWWQENIFPEMQRLLYLNLLHKVVRVHRTIK
jgi:PAS domain-containing protein